MPAKNRTATKRSLVCNRLRNKYLLYLDSDDLTVQEMRQIDNHLERCSECRRDMMFWGKVENYIRAMRTSLSIIQQRPPSLADRIIRKRGEELFENLVRYISDEEIEECCVMDHFISVDGVRLGHA